MALLVFFSGIAKAEHYYYQVPEKSYFANGYVVLKNKSKESSFVDLFLMSHTSGILKQRLHLKALESIKVKSDKLFENENSMAYFFVDISNKYGVNISIQSEENLIPLPAKTGIQYQVANLNSLKLHNFSSNISEFSILDKNNNKIESIKINAYSSKIYELNGAAYKIQSSQPSLISFQSRESWNFLSPSKYKLKRTKDSAYFLVSAKIDSPYSFVIELKDKEKISQARQHLKEDNPENYHIVNGKIAINDLTNLLLSTKFSSAWSWKLTDIEFSQFGGNFCNLHSLEIEINLKKLLETDARACNWEFRILQEL